MTNLANHERKEKEEMILKLSGQEGREHQKDSSRVKERKTSTKQALLPGTAGYVKKSEVSNVPKKGGEGKKGVTVLRRKGKNSTIDIHKEILTSDKGI